MPAFPRWIPAVDSSKDKSSSKDPPVVVGTDLLVLVTCEKRRQPYCLLCSVRLKNKDHMTSNSHRYEYIKYRYPDWGMDGEPGMDEAKMLKVVTNLAEVEKEKGIFYKTVEVNSETYNRLATVSAEEALAEVKVLVDPSPSGSHGASHSADAVHPSKGPSEQPQSFKVPKLPRRSLDGDKRSIQGAQIVATPMAPAPKTDKNLNNGDHCEEAEPNPGARPCSLTGVAREAAMPTPEPRRTSPSSARSPPPQISTTTPGGVCEPEMKNQRLSVSPETTEKGKGPSYLSMILRGKPEPIIGLAFVFECRGITRDTFCLCGTCSKTFPIKLMCEHIVSSEHQHTYMLKDYPQFMSWWGQDFPLEKKQGLLRDIASMISKRELYDQMDAQVILLHKDYYDYIRTAPFSQALDMLQKISRGKKKKLSGLFGYPKQLCPQTSDAPATREPRSADATTESSAREKDLSVTVEGGATELHSFAGDIAPLNGVLQDTVNDEPTLPVVGLSAIVECSCEEQTPFYLCVACDNILSQGLVLLHVHGSSHFQQYLSARYPWCFEGLLRAGDVGVLPAELLQRARELVKQDRDEPGAVQRIPLPLEDFSRIRTMRFDKALSRLHAIYRNRSQSELLTCVTSKPRPATKQPFVDGSADSDRVKQRRLSGPPADREALARLKSPDAPRLPAVWSHLMEREEEVVRDAKEPLSSQARGPAPQALPGLHATQPGVLMECLPSLNFDPNPSRPPVTTPGVNPVPFVEPMDSLTGTRSLEQAASFPALCPQSLSESNDQAAAIPLVSMTHEPDKGAAPGAHKADSSSLMNMAADIVYISSQYIVYKYSEAAGYSKDKTKCNSKPRPEKSRTKRALSYDRGSKATSYYPILPRVSSSVPSSTNCSAGSFAGPVSRIGVTRGALNTSNPHAENTAKPRALLPRKDLVFQGYLRLEQTQTGTNQPLQLLKEPATTVGSVPRSTGPLAANLGAMACSGRSASTQRNSLTHNSTEETPGIAGSRGYSTGQPSFPPGPRHANGYVDYGAPSTPTVWTTAPSDPPLRSANMNLTAVGTPRGGPPDQSLQPPMFGQMVCLPGGQLASQLPTQRLCIVVARGVPSWPSAAPSPSYHNPANYSQGLPRTGTYSNNIVISNPNLPRSTFNLLGVQGFQATTTNNLTHATAATSGVLTSERRPEGVASLHFTNGAANWTN